MSAIDITHFNDVKIYDDVIIYGNNFTSQEIQGFNNLFT